MVILLFCYFAFALLIKEIPKHNYYPSTPSQSIKLQRASAETCLLPIEQIHLQLSVVLPSSEPLNCQKMDAQELMVKMALGWVADKCYHIYYFSYAIFIAILLLCYSAILLFCYSAIHCNSAISLLFCHSLL